MNCENCADLMTPVPGKTHCFCYRCEAFGFATKLEEAPEAIEPAGRTVEFMCPNCEAPLQVGKLLGQANVCYCERCRGFVIDNQSLAKLIEEARASYRGADEIPTPMNAAELDIKRRCPACWQSMDTHPYYGAGNSVMDTCAACQLAWLDHGELIKIIRAPGVRHHSTRSF